MESRKKLTGCSKVLKNLIVYATNGIGAQYRYEESHRMKSVCLDARKIEDGGIGTYIQNILINWSNLSFKLSLLLSPLAFEKWSELKRKFSVISCQAPTYSLQEQLILPKVIPKCDLFWSPHFNVPLFPIRAKKRLVTIHDVFHLAHLSKLSFLERYYAKTVIPQAVKRSEQIITVSSFTRNELLRLTSASAQDIQVIPLAVNQDLFCMSVGENKEKDLRKQYGIPENYFLFVGNQKAHKNLEGTCKAFSQFLSETQSNCFLVLVGSGIGLRHVEDLSRLLDRFPGLRERVIPIGFVAEKDLPFLYQSAISLVFPSFYEGFGLPPLEAMSSGCPVIASRAASLEEVCGDAVYYVDPYDFESLTHGMKRLWKDEVFRKELKRKGKKHVETFSWKNVADEHQKSIESLIA